MMRRSRIRGERGVAAVELAILLGFVLVPIAFGITEIGRALYQYEALTKSARAAARYLAVHDSSFANTQAEAKCLAVYGIPQSSCDGAGLVPVVPNLTTANVAVDVPSSSAALRAIATGVGTMDLVTVTISPTTAPYRFVSIVPFIFPSLDFAPISAAMPQSVF